MHGKTLKHEDVILHIVMNDYKTRTIMSREGCVLTMLNPYLSYVESDSTALSSAPGPVSNSIRHIILHFMSVCPKFLLSIGLFGL